MQQKIMNVMPIMHDARSSRSSRPAWCCTGSCQQPHRHRAAVVHHAQARKRAQRAKRDASLTQALLRRYSWSHDDRRYRHHRRHRHARRARRRGHPAPFGPDSPARSRGASPATACAACRRAAPLPRRRRRGARSGPGAGVSGAALVHRRGRRRAAGPRRPACCSTCCCAPRAHGARIARPGEFSERAFLNEPARSRAGRSHRRSHRRRQPPRPRARRSARSTASSRGACTALVEELTRPARVRRRRARFLRRGHRLAVG